MVAGVYTRAYAIADKVRLFDIIKGIESPVLYLNGKNGKVPLGDIHPATTCNLIYKILKRLFEYHAKSGEYNLLDRSELARIQASIEILDGKFCFHYLDNANNRRDEDRNREWGSCDSFENAAEILSFLKEAINVNTRPQETPPEQPEQAENPKSKAGRRKTYYDDYIIAQYLGSAVLTRIEKDITAASTAEEAYRIMRAAMAIGVFLNNENDKMPFSAIQRRFGIFPNDRPQNNKDSQKRLNRIENLRSIYEQLK